MHETSGSNRARKRGRASTKELGHSVRSSDRDRDEGALAVGDVVGELEMLREQLRRARGPISVQGKELEEMRV